MKTTTSLQTRFALLSVLMAALLVTLFAGNSYAQTDLGCSEEFKIEHQFANGAEWEMCWEERLNEGIVYYDIYYTTSHGLRRKVLGQMNLAQIHVPYDNSENRYHDVTDYGLAAPNSSGNNLLTLAAGECPNGQLYGSTRNLICKQTHDHGYAWKDYIDYGVKETMSIFNVSRVQRYYYIIAYEFHDDGEIEPTVAASGKLQAYLYSNNSNYQPHEAYGWEINEIMLGDIPTKVRGVNHTHNYWWRLDFDLGGAANDVFEEIEFLPANNDFRRVMTATTYTTEVARQTSPETFRSWRVKDTVLGNQDGHSISYDILPNGSNVYRGPSVEPWTQNNIYATTSRACERFISHNSEVLDCEGNDNVVDFTDGEVLTDTVVWYGVTFHHLVRDEDDSRMPAHAEGFNIVPRDWTKENPADMQPLASTAVQLSSTVQSERPFASINANVFLLAASFVFVVGTVIVRQNTKNRDN